MGFIETASPVIPYVRGGPFKRITWRKEDTLRDRNQAQKPPLHYSLHQMQGESNMFTGENSRRTDNNKAQEDATRDSCRGDGKSKDALNELLEDMRRAHAAVYSPGYDDFVELPSSDEYLEILADLDMKTGPKLHWIKTNSFVHSSSDFLVLIKTNLVAGGYLVMIPVMTRSTPQYKYPARNQRIPRICEESNSSPRQRIPHLLENFLVRSTGSEFSSYILGHCSR